MPYVPYKTKKANRPNLLQFAIRIPETYHERLKILAAQLAEPGRTPSVAGTMAKIVMERLDKIKGQEEEVV